ncbi:MAG: permease [Candidatus Hydrogenedentota bacterium]|nr:MAG: permease [Candidatus Hydrogenedentota bacterium]
MLDTIVSFIVYDLGGLSPLSMWGKAVHFFLYEVIFLSALLLTIVFAISMVRSYLGTDRIRRALGSRRSTLAAFGGAMVGAITPFCSCSAVPVFTGLVKASAPAAGVCAFLTASPLITEIALALIGGLFGWKTAVLYIGFGTGIAVLVGVTVERLHARGRFQTIDTCPGCGSREDEAVTRTSLLYRLRASWGTGMNTLRRMSPYFVASMALASVIHGFVPETTVAVLADAAGPLAVPTAVLLRLPLYSGTATAALVGFAFAEKGISIGTVVAFMMSVTALSLPEFVMLRTVLPIRSLIVLAVIVAFSITATGYLFNLVLG